MVHTAIPVAEILVWDVNGLAAALHVCHYFSIKLSADSIFEIVRTGQLPEKVTVHAADTFEKQQWIDEINECLVSHPANPLNRKLTDSSGSEQPIAVLAASS